MDSLEGFLRGGLEREDVPASEEDIALMRMVDSVYGPAMRGLMDADLSAEDAELDLDPSRAPRAGE